MGNKTLWIGEDENGEQHELDGSEKPAKPEKVTPKFIEEAASMFGMTQGPKGEDADEDYIIEAVIPRVLEQIRQPEDGKDGADADVELIIREMLPLVMENMPKPEKINEASIVSKVLSRIRIPQDGKPGEKGKDGSPDTPVEVKAKLESLEGDDRLDAKAIKNLPRTFSSPSVGGVSRLQDLSDVTLTSPTNNQALTYDSATGKWVNETVSGGSGTPGGADTQVQFNDGGSFGGDAGLVFNKTTNKLTGAGDLELTSTDTVDGTKRLILSSYERAVYPNHYGELVRLDWAKADAKPSIAFRDNFTNPGTPVSKGWLLAHDYLLYTDAAYTKTFVDANVNTTTDRITITSHGFSNADGVKLWTTGGALPTGIAHLKQYYAKAIDANTIELYRDSGLTLLINITAATGGGTHNIANVTLGNNPHRHMSMEVSDSTGAVQTRFEIPYDLDSTFIKVVDADFILTGGKKLQMTGENGVNKDLTFGLDETSVYTRWALRQDSTTESGSNVGSDFKIVRYSDAGVALDSSLTITRSTGLVTAAGNIESNGTILDLDSATTASVISDRGATTNFASFILRTAGTDQWGIRLTNDSTNNLYIRDLVNGVNILQAALGATPTVTLGGSWRFSNAVVPAASDGAALGSTTLQWSDLFLAEGAVINFNNGNAAITHSAGLLTSNVAFSIGTSLALTAGTIELGHASDTTLSRSAAGTLAVEGVRVQTTSPLVVSAASYTTDTGTSLNMDNLDMFVITAQAGALLFNAPGGTLVQGRKLMIRIKDNGTARALTWNAVFRAMGVALPSTTVLSKTLYLGFVYNSTDTKWDLVASAQEA